jgi:hypothetical protein
MCMRKFIDIIKGAGRNSGTTAAHQPADGWASSPLPSPPNGGEGEDGRRIIKRLGKAGAALLALSALSGQSSAFAQATTEVFPRQYHAVSNLLLTANMTANTNGNLYAPVLALNGTNQVGGWAPTFIPFSGAHAIGLTAIIGCTNKYAAASNCVVVVYPAYDTSGGGASINNPKYGTNFTATPMLTWTISYQTNSTQSTNIPIGLWEPATALGYVVSNTVASNISLTLIQATTP